MVGGHDVTRARRARRPARFYPAVMRSAARLTYNQAHEALFMGEPAARAQLGMRWSNGCCRWWTSITCCSRRARARGALEFDAPEAEFVHRGRPARARHRRFMSRNEAHKLIEECMVLANVAVAQELRPAARPALFRVHAARTKRSSTSCARRCTCWASRCSCPNRCTARLAGHRAARARSAERPFVESLVVRSMAQALYQPDQHRPLRPGAGRLRAFHLADPALSGPDDSPRAARATGLRRTAAASSTRRQALSRRAWTCRGSRGAPMKPTVTCRTFLKCVYLRDRVGQTFDGLITTVMEFGCFVQLLDVGGRRPAAAGLAARR